MSQRLLSIADLQSSPTHLTYLVVSDLKKNEGQIRTRTRQALLNNTVIQNSSRRSKFHGLDQYSADSSCPNANASSDKLPNLVSRTIVAGGVSPGKGSYYLGDLPHFFKLL